MPENKKTILVVEDDPVLSVMYKTKLEAEGYTIFTAANGVEALAEAKAEKPDLILLDIILPQLDGFSVLEELKDDTKTKKIPVIMLTNLGTDEDREKGQKLGAVDYLVKANYTPEQISSEIKKFL
ncbi:response regulator [Candidatus Falkowbacteria bacterium]|nr:response regulator [Candidatus Falkowbacteria bacterium]